MPDIETLPLDKLPPLAVTRRDAEWEQTFKQPEPTSLAGRYWERQDQATVAHAANQQARADAALQQKVMNDSVAQSFYFKAQELPMKVAEHDLQMREGLADLAHKQKLQPMELEAKQLGNQTLRQSQLDEVEDRKFKANLAAQELEGNRNFRAMIESSGAKFGTPEYTKAVANARLQSPGANKAYADDIWKGTGSELSLDDAVKQHQAGLAAAGPNTTVTTKLPGGGTMTDRPTLAADRTLAANQLGRAQARRDRASKAADEEGTKQANEDIELWSGKLAEADAARTGTEQPATDARKVIAQKALSDPNASEAHKTAARRILGQ